MWRPRTARVHALLMMRGCDEGVATIALKRRSRKLGLAVLAEPSAELRVRKRELNILVAESEPPAAREKRRESVGKSSGETFEDLLVQIEPDARVRRIKPADSSSGPRQTDPREFDAIILTGSPLHLYLETAETRRIVEFMGAVFASGTPSFGSCAGLQVAAVTAGGRVRPMGHRREAGFARRIVPTDRGRGHALLEGRPLAFDAPAIHTDEVAILPEHSTSLAANRVTAIQAAEIRYGESVFWGVQYHPEISLFEVAGALRRQSADLIENGLARGEEDVEAQARLVDALYEEPARRDLAWRLGLDEQVTDPRYRTIEIRNFIEHLVRPTLSRRGRG